MRLPTRRVVLLTCLVAAGCGRPDPAPVVAFAIPRWGWRNVVVAREALAVSDLLSSVRIEYDSASTGDDTDTEVERAHRLRGLPGLTVVVGHGGSRGSLVAIPLYEDSGLPVIEPTGTSGRLAAAGPCVFPLSPPEDAEAAFIVDFLVSRSVRSALVYYVSDDYGTGLERSFAEAAARTGIEITGRVGFSTRTDLASLVATSLSGQAPDAVIVLGRSRSTARIVSAAYALQPQLLFVGGDGIELTGWFVEDLGGAAPSTFVAWFWDPASPGARSRDFVERYERLVGEPPQSIHALRHDALMLAATVAAEVGPDPAAACAWLAGLGIDHPPFEGITGPISFGERPGHNLYMLEAATREVVFRRDRASTAEPPEGGR